MGFWFDILHGEKKKTRRPIEDEEGKQIGEYETYDFVPETETTWDPDIRTLGRKFPKFTIDISDKEEEEGKKIMDSTMKIVSKKLQEFYEKHGRFPETAVTYSEWQKPIHKEFCVIDDGEEEKKTIPLSYWDKILVWMSWYPDKFWKNSDFMKEPYFIGYEAPNRVCDLVRLGYVEKGEREGKFSTYRITKEGIKQVTEIFKNNHLQNKGKLHS